MSQDDSFKTATEDPTPASEHLRLGDKRPADEAVPTAARHVRPSRLPRAMGNSGPLPASATDNSASPYAAPAAALAALPTTDAETAAALRRIAQGGAPVTANLGTQGAHSFQLAGAHTQVSISHDGQPPPPPGTKKDERIKAFEDENQKLKKAVEAMVVDIGVKSLETANGFNSASSK
ncbi:hypothetical protein OC842_007261, partial [Tilletia horrida]